MATIVNPVILERPHPHHAGEYEIALLRSDARPPDRKHPALVCRMLIDGADKIEPGDQLVKILHTTKFLRRDIPLLIHINIRGGGTCRLLSSVESIRGGGMKNVVVLC